MRCCLLVLLLLNACATARFAAPPFSGRTLSSAEKADFLSQLDQRAKQVSSFKALYSAKISEAGGEAISIKQALVFSKPNKLRIEAFPLNQSIALSLFVSDGQRATFIDHGSGERLDGVSGGDILRATLKIPLAEADFISLIIGAIPAQFLVSANVEVQSNEDSKQYLVLSNDKHAWWLVDGKNFLLISGGISEQFQDTGVLEVRYSGDEREQQGIYIPAGIDLNIRDNISASLVLRSSQVNTQVQSAVFQAP
jgi:outer membrane lipoprotein-sorting protein